MNPEAVRLSIEAVRAGLTNRTLTRVLLDSTVTLEFIDPRPRIQVKLEEAFTLVDATGLRVDVEPERLGLKAGDVARLFAAVVSHVDIHADGTLELRFEDGRVILAPPGMYESWSYSEDGGPFIVCGSSDVSYWPTPDNESS